MCVGNAGWRLSNSMTWKVTSRVLAKCTDATEKSAVSLNNADEFLAVIICPLFSCPYSDPRSAYIHNALEDRGFKGHLIPPALTDVSDVLPLSSIVSPMLLRVAFCSRSLQSVYKWRSRNVPAMFIWHWTRMVTSCWPMTPSYSNRPERWLQDTRIKKRDIQNAGRCSS